MFSHPFLIFLSIIHLIFIGTEYLPFIEHSLELRCHQCLQLIPTETYIGHQCKSVGEINEYLTKLSKPRKALMKPSYQMFLNDLEELESESQTATLNPTYMLHLMIQDSQGKIYDD